MSDTNTMNRRARRKTTDLTQKEKIREEDLLQIRLADEELDAAAVCLVATFIGFICAVITLITWWSFPLALSVYVMTGLMTSAAVLLARRFL
ncbi:MAG: hypothetical protein ABJN34_05605 [Litoreibacter sp.]|uniref:hypothetical protein n=1 Tax=Litoreibacter sp. TaxID=1969459 RepID=UPI00329A1DDC